MNAPQQLDLLTDSVTRPMSVPRARRSDSQTSHQAAEKAAAFAANHEAKCYGAICVAGERGATFKEIATSSGMEPVAVARRLGAMEKRKLITRRLNAHPKNDRDYEQRDGCAVWRKA